MIRFTTGDLFDANVDALVNTVNTVGVMGKGLALQFKRRYPDNFTEYAKACKKGEVVLGKMFVTRSPELSGPRYIVNFPTKGHWRANSRLSDIRLGLQDLHRTILELGIRSIAIPPLGAGNGGLSWPDVRTLIQEAAQTWSDVDVIVFEPKVAVRRLEARKIPATRSRVLMLELLQGYLRRREAVEPWEPATGASHLEIQKLMYFASLQAPSLHLRFEQGHFGPYSDVVRVMLAEMEGTFTEGFGDGTSKVLGLDPISVTPRGETAVSTFEDPYGNRESISTLVALVLKRIEGFEGPYPLELISSVQWASPHTSSSNVEPVLGYIRSWNQRKGRIFTEMHVATALERLQGSVTTSGS